MARGSDAHLRRLRNLASPATMRNISRALFVGGNKVQVAAQIKITTGAVSGRDHVPSRPGEAPNQDSGVLANNIETTQPEPFTVEVSSNAPYAAPLEFGTSRMAERPYMRPARDETKPEVIRLVTEALDRADRSRRR